MPAQVGWTKLTPTVARMANRLDHLMVIRNQQSKSYIGQLVEVTDQYVTLVNGDDRETLYFSQGHMQFTMLEGPTSRAYKLSEPKLPFE